ncbi:MAG: hypothetical protein JOZ07_04455 [Solirubrobacterales bacterium]|nr:hypothetical protein [Solirubrobacterales bacterium]
MTAAAVPGATPPGATTLESAVAAIAAGAAARDAQLHPRFPRDAFCTLRAGGALRWNATVGRQRPPAADELALVRRVAAADGSVGRIFDGHLNAIERLAVHAPADVRERERQAAIAGTLLAGVWGGDPVPGEGPPAAVVGSGRRQVLRGVKTFCSGAGGCNRALVLARPSPDPDAGPPVMVWVDALDARHVLIDETWYRAHGLRASVSHRVVFRDAPVIAMIGEPGAIAEQPWFGRDALRTAASWAGMADTAVEAALDALRARPRRGELEALAAGRILAAQRTIDVWLAAGARAMDRAEAHLAETALFARTAIADACRALLDEAARACGSRPFALAEDLDRARRDLELFMLQHRLEPLLARAGEAALERT